MRGFISIVLFSVILLKTFSVSFAVENKILFKINNEIITSLDILTEIKYLALINSDFKKLSEFKTFEIAKKSIIREKIKEIELINLLKEIKIDDATLNNVLLPYFSKIGIGSINEFNNFFLNQDINPDIIKQKVMIEILWNQMIYRKFKNKVNVDKKLIKDGLLKNKMQKEFLLSEILFELNEDEKLNKKYKVILEEINTKSFEQAVLSYSVSDTRNDGGKLGWIKESVLGPKIKNEIKKKGVGHVTSPLVIPGGFLILKIENIRNIQKELDLEKEIELVYKDKVNKQLNQFSNIYFNKIKNDVKINEK